MLLIDGQLYYLQPKAWWIREGAQCCLAVGWKSSCCRGRSCSAILWCLLLWRNIHFTIAGILTCLSIIFQQISGFAFAFATSRAKFALSLSSCPSPFVSSHSANCALQSSYSYWCCQVDLDSVCVFSGRYDKSNSSTMHKPVFFPEAGCWLEFTCQTCGNASDCRPAKWKTLQPKQSSSKWQGVLHASSLPTRDTRTWKQRRAMTGILECGRAAHLRLIFHGPDRASSFSFRLLLLTWFQIWSLNFRHKWFCLRKTGATIMCKWCPECNTGKHQGWSEQVWFLVARLNFHAGSTDFVLDHTRLKRIGS